MDIQKENNLILEAFEIEADQIGFCLDRKWGGYENPYDNSDTALAFSLFKKGWQAAKAQAVPEGFVLVEKKNTEGWYLDDFEGMYWDHDGIDGSLCELDIGQVQAVEHKEYLITESNTLYAAKTWDDANDQVDCWQFFKTKDEAEKAAAYCKKKFNDEPVEAQEQKG